MIDKKILHIQENERVQEEILPNFLGLKSSVIQQLTYTIIITNNHAPNLVKYQKVSKYYDHNTMRIFLFKPFILTNARHWLFLVTIVVKSGVYLFLIFIYFRHYLQKQNTVAAFRVQDQALQGFFEKFELSTKFKPSTTVATLLINSIFEKTSKYFQNLLQKLNWNFVYSSGLASILAKQIFLSTSSDVS